MRTPSSRDLDFVLVRTWAEPGHIVPRLLTYRAVF